MNITPKFSIIILIALLTLNSCANRGDARKSSPNPKDRVAKNLKEGRGFSLNEALSNRGKGGDFEFASSNELWRATLDVIDFMPLTSANYSGGIVITDWYSDNDNSSESIKIIIKFLTNEIRSDALDLKIFYKNCNASNNCRITSKDSKLVLELKKEILKKASIYKKKSEIDKKK